MKHLWLVLLPLFCLPDLLFAQQTAVGVLKWTDYLIGPYLLSVTLAGGLRPTPSTRPLTVVLLVFCAWAVISTVTVPLRYGYASDYFVRVGLVKVGKFALYAVAGLATLRVVSATPQYHGYLRWSVLAALVTVAMSVYFSSTSLSDLPSTPREAGFRYEATNAVSILMSMLLAFVLGEWAGRTHFAAWRNVGVLVLPGIVLGFFLTGGRAGWIGLLIALAYVLFRAGLRPAFVLAGLVLVLIGYLVYGQNESFSHHVDITINPELLAEETDFARTTGFDDGNRVKIFVTESQKFVRSPIFGSGMFHRGFASGLYTTGSHNFFLQMFLETGIVGGIAIVLFFRRLWLIACGRLVDAAQSQLGSQATLIAAAAGGFTGEYFYGGPGLLMLFVLVAPSLARSPAPAIAMHQPVISPGPEPIRLQPHA